MPTITYAKNIGAIQAQRELARTTTDIGRVYQRLSSGQRINNASDDAAGLSVSSLLKADTKIFAQAIRNVNDGVSRLNIADDALGQLSQILQRQAELAEQAANGTYSFQQRKALNQEANALVDEFNRIIQSTKFNDTALLATPSTTTNIQAGSGSNAVLSMTTNAELDRLVGSGSFQSPTSIATGASTIVATTTADLNGDGNQDLIFGGNQITVMLGNGNGTFLAPQTYAATFAQHDVHVADFNGDGVPDILATSSNGAAILTLLGNSDGTFRAATSFSGSSNSYRATVADFNNDGYLDVAANAYTANKVDIFLGNGNGTFRARVSYMATSTNAYGLDASDVNRDGVLDLVVGDNNGSSFAVLLGNTDGSFRSRSLFSVGSEATGNITLADVNRDGYDDVITAQIVSATGRVMISLGNGDGSFSSATSYLTGGVYTTKFSVGDLTGDGVLDIATANYDSNSISVLLGNANGSFSYGRTFSSSGNGPHSIAIADLNNDGVPDLSVGAATALKANIFLAQTTTVTTIGYHHMFSQAEAKASLTTINTALDRVNSERGVVGAWASRFEHSLNMLQASHDGSQAAYSRITDSDVAQDSAEMIRLQTLQQATTAVLAQSNLQPQIALDLLKF